MLKGLFRKPFVTVFCMFLIIIAFLLSSFGEAMTASYQVTLPERKTLELAVLKADTDALNPNELYKIYNNAHTAFSDPYTMDVRTFGAAYSEGLIPAHASNPEKYRFSATPAALVILVGTCTEAEQTYSEVARYYKNYYTFEIDEVVYKNEFYKVDIQTVKYFDSSKEPDILEIGKQYLFWGYYISGTDNNKVSCPTGRNSTGHGAMKNIEQEGLHWIVEATKGTGNYTPLISEINQPLDAFLKTEAGQYWQKAVFAKIEVCESTLGVMGTDCLESIPAWNTMDCKLVAGEVFTEEQYATGERVCLISEEVASLNSLAVGDSLPLRLFSSHATYDSGITRYENTFDPYAGFIDEGEWRVIGIYYSDYDSEPNDFDIHPNMIFVPNQAVTCYREHSDWSLMHPPGMSSDSSFSVILPEGGWEQFALQAGIMGYSDWFEYNNGHTPESEAARDKELSALTAWQETVAEKTKPITVISAILIFAATLIYALSKKKEIGQIYAIETPYTRIFFHIFVQSVLISIVAVGVSAVAVCFVLPPITVSVLSRLADPVYADAWISMVTIKRDVMLSAFACPALVMLGAALLSSLIGAKRKFHFEYHEKR